MKKGLEKSHSGERPLAGRKEFPEAEDICHKVGGWLGHAV